MILALVWVLEDRDRNHVGVNLHNFIFFSFGKIALFQTK